VRPGTIAKKTMSSWADVSEDPAPAPAPAAAAGGAPRERPRLQLKPRSAEGAAEAARSDATGGKAKSNPFGAAKPREEVLQKKGVDVKLVDSRIDKKAEVLHFTKQQEEEVEAVRSELTRAEDKLREANEMELPEETYRVACEQKKKELNDLMAKFTELNVKKKKEKGDGAPGAGGGGGGEGRPRSDSSSGGQRHHYERPSERRRRLEEERGGGYQNNDYDDGGDDPFKSFGGRSRRSGSGSYKGGGGRGGSTGNPHWD